MTIYSVEKLRYTVYCKGDILFFETAWVFPRTINNHYRPSEKWYLWAAFTEKNDALDYRWMAGQVGSYARCLKLRKITREILLEQYKWGVWVPQTHASRLAQINCSWGQTGGFEVYQPKNGAGLVDDVMHNHPDFDELPQNEFPYPTEEGP